MGARAAARKSGNDADEDAKAEMQAKMEELQEQLRQAEEKSNEVQKQAAVLQVKLDEARKEQGLLEESVHEHTERINDLDHDKKESLRARREMEQIYESERASFTKEREIAQAREEEMQASMQRMKEALAQREMRAGLDEDGRKPNLSRNSSFRNSLSASPNPEAGGQFAPPSSLQRSDSRSSSKLVMQKDKIIESLRIDMAEAQIKIVEMENMGGGRLQKLETEMYEVKMQNARLMEENESFQLLLSEKTLNGDFSQSEFLRAPSTAGSRPSSRHAPGNSLADELAGEDDGESSDDVRRLQAEVNSAKDQNKALTLYINNIISRLLQHDQFEAILDKTPDMLAGPHAASTRFQGSADTEKELPPPPPEKDEAAPAGFLQRAKSVMGAGKRPRPQSTIIPSDNAPKLEEARPNENPETAPAVPFNARRSVSGGHRRANSEWAGSVVNNMYRGPSPGGMGPASPGLTSPISQRNGFFAAAQPLGSRMPSGSTVPTVATIAETPPTEAPPANKETAQRDSKFSNPRNSMISNPSNPSSSEPQEAASTDVSNPSSPPRSITSSGDRESRAGGGAVMMGSKMRPLRLVKEAEETNEAAKKQANRGSWFGWMNKGGPAPAGTGQ